MSLGVALAMTSADAGRKKKNKKKKKGDEIERVVAPAPKPRTKPIPLFDTPLPLDVGPIPSGLANQSATGCAACHFKAHADWSHSAHAGGWRRPDFQEAVRVAGTPACTVCHLPLVTQRPELLTFDQGDVDKPVTGDNPGFDAGLRIEGVTCAACHVRNGKIVAARPPEEIGDAPHPLAWSKELATSEGCAACHQLSWPGSNAPFYDTYGEWDRSPHAKAGIGCIDCHGGPGASDTASLDHGMPRGIDRAVSILIDLPGLEVVRGGDPVPVALTLQNTGAGHAFPTGSPFKGVQVQVWLEGPPEDEGEAPTRTEAFTTDLARTLSDGPPWNTEADTRIPAGGQVEIATEVQLEHNVPAGAWSLRIRLVETVRGEATDRVLVERDLPVRVE